MPSKIKAALEAAKAAIWDKYYGHELAVAYIQEVSSEIDAALRELEAAEKLHSEGEYNARIDCLSMFVRRFYRKLRKHEPDAEVIQQANTYLKAIGQAGTPLRIEECSTPLAGRGREVCQTHPTVMADRAELERRARQENGHGDGCNAHWPFDSQKDGFLCGECEAMADFAERIQRETAERCMEIAKACGDKKPLGAYRTFRKIRAEFGIEAKS